MRHWIITATLLGLALPAVAEDRALFIGVDRYDDLGRFSNGNLLARADDAVRAAGYGVDTLEDGTGAAMAAALQNHLNATPDATRQIITLSGRFVTDGTRTWLLADEADAFGLFSLGGAAISVDSVLQVLAQTPGQAILLLGLDDRQDDRIDAYLREGVGDLTIPQGVTVIAGAPGALDDALRDGIVTPGADLAAYLRDARRLSAFGYLPETLVLQPVTDDTAPAPVPETAPAPVPSLAFWDAARAADTADSYRDFIFRFPDSPFTDAARARLDEIENDPERLAQLAEDDLNLTREARRDIQRDLTLLGFSTRGVDGIFGPGTRGAIRNWQQENGFTQTSYLDAEQINRLDAQAAFRAAEIERQEAEERRAAEQRDRDFWEETGARGNAAGYRAYLDRFPNGLFAEQARNRLATLEDQTTRRAEPDTGNNNGNRDTDRARQREEALNINALTGRLIESRLAQSGFNPGPVDGQFNGATRRALRQFQRARGLTATGFVDQPTLARLLTETFR